ncbi:Nn.00g093900.m01.CDS01 [Neocucurbitaria sp. VM-36]
MAKKSFTYKGVVLKGHENYLRWKRELIVHTDTEGVTALFYIPNTNNTETILNEPAVPNRKVLTAEARRLLTDENFIQTCEKELRTEYLEEIEIYQFESSLYDKQQKRLQKCKKLLLGSVDKTIKPQVTDMMPAECWAFLKSRFGMPNSVVAVYQQLRDTELGDFGSVQAYINQIYNLVSDLKAAGLTLTDQQIYTAILGGLTPQFKQQLGEVWSNSSIGTDRTTDQLITRLLELESIVSRHLEDVVKELDGRFPLLPGME